MQKAYTKPMLTRVDLAPTEMLTDFVCKLPMFQDGPGGLQDYDGCWGGANVECKIMGS